MSSKKIIDTYTSNYKKWKSEGLEKGGYFVIFNGFKSKHLREISGQALKLYIYMGLHSGNFTGESWHSAETIKEYFGVSIRTIQNWISELENIGLIKRLQKRPNSVSYTYLIPYDLEITDEDNEDE